MTSGCVRVKAAAMPPHSKARRSLLECGATGPAFTSVRAGARSAPAAGTVLLVFLLASPALAAPNVRPPEFQSTYQLPATTAPNSYARFYDYLDVAALLVALLAASYLALKRRSRAGLFALLLLSLAYFGFWRSGCICPIGAIQNVAAGICNSSYAVPLAVLAFFLLPLAFALLFGRTFCAAVCPLGAVQDLMALRPLKVPNWLEHSLGLLAYAYLGMAVLLATMGSAYVICRFDPFVSLFRLVPLGQWVRGGTQAPGGIQSLAGRVDLLALLGFFLAVGVFIARPYCRFLCPLGAIFRVLSRLSWRHTTITPKECVKCRLCEDSCPFGAIRPPTPAVRFDRRRERRRLAAILALLPVLIAIGTALGRVASRSLSHADYTIRLAEQVAAEDAGVGVALTDASKAFRSSHRSKQELMDESAAIQRRYAVGSGFLGSFLGLVVGGKLVTLSLRRRRENYEPDRGRCLSCGRCFAACPVGNNSRRGAETAETKGIEKQKIGIR